MIKDICEGLGWIVAVLIVSLWVIAVTAMPIYILVKEIPVLNANDKVIVKALKQYNHSHAALNAKVASHEHKRR